VKENGVFFFAKSPLVLEMIMTSQVVYSVSIEANHKIKDVRISGNIEALQLKLGSSNVP